MAGARAVPGIKSRYSVLVARHQQPRLRFVAPRAGVFVLVFFPRGDPALPPVVLRPGSRGSSTQFPCRRLVLWVHNVSAIDG